MNRLNVLLVAYAFPPVGGAGVQRVLKLSKYLPLYGVTPAVLTVRNPSAPLRDACLDREVPSDLVVIRAPTLEPSYSAKQRAWSAVAARPTTRTARARRRLVDLARRLLVPDPQVLWLPGSALALARRLRSDEADDVLFISGPPFSQFLLSLLAGLRPGTAVVLDYRDEWTVVRGGYEMGGGTRVSAALERALVRRAHAITVATDEFRAELLRRFPFLDPARVWAIPNGYDPDDFPADLPEPPTDRFVLTYVGTVFRLTSASGFLLGLRLLREREPELARLLDVRFIGRIVETEVASFGDAGSLGVSVLGYLEHREAVAALAASHAVLCILSDQPGAERICPAKIFEIMHLGRPCLALSPEGVLSRLVRQHGLGEVVSPGDPEAIAAALARRLRAFRHGGAATGRHHATMSSTTDRFDRKRLAGEFAEVFRGAVAFARERAQPRGESESASLAPAK